MSKGSSVKGSSFGVNFIGVPFKSSWGQRHELDLLLGLQLLLFYTVP